MQKLDEAQIKQWLSMGSERRDLEFKSPFTWTDTSSIWLQEKVICAILAMSNTRNGGVIIIGVNEKNVPIGMTDTQVKSFENYEDIKRLVDGFASLATDFEIYLAETDKRKFVVFIVRDFYETPIICRKNGDVSVDVLKQDKIYARSLKAQYSSKMADVFELTEIINLAVDKQTNRLKERGWTRDCPFMGPMPEKTAKTEDVEKFKEIFDKEIEDME
jgi:predicted HTH transcriptional regulator